MGMIKLLFAGALYSGVTLALVSCKTVPYFKSFAFTSVNSSESLFKTVVKPALELRCVHCHNNAISNGGLNLQDRDLIFSVDQGRAFMVPGDPEASRIWQAIILPEKHPDAMPYKGWGLTDDELRFILAWIKKGAEWPLGDAGFLEIKGHSAD